MSKIDRVVHCQLSILASVSVEKKNQSSNCNRLFKTPGKVNNIKYKLRNLKNNGNICGCEDDAACIYFTYHIECSIAVKFIT